MIRKESLIISLILVFSLPVLAQTSLFKSLITQNITDKTLESRNISFKAAMQNVNAKQDRYISIFYKDKYAIKTLIAYQD